MHPIALTPTDALLVTDVQNDFLPGGSLAVAHADEVIAPINRLIALYGDHGLPVYASRCWHPPDHCSFTERGGPWPAHCVAHTHGAAFADGLALPAGAAIISKGTHSDKEAYSAFRDTTLAEQLRAHGVERLAVCGLTTDYCVLNSASDALALGFRVMVVLDAIRAVDVQPGDGERALRLLVERGAVLVHSTAPTLLGEAALVEAGGEQAAGGLLHSAP
jgi:nicotinamidase/pyrazinamidase